MRKFSGICRYEINLQMDKADLQPLMEDSQIASDVELLG